MSTARNARRLSKKNPDANKALAALTSLGDVAKMAEAMMEVQIAAATLVQDNQRLQRRVDRLEFVLTQMVENAYTLLGTSFGPRLNEPYPRVDWEARRKSFEYEYDKEHPEPEAGEET